MYMERRYGLELNSNDIRFDRLKKKKEVFTDKFYIIIQDKSLWTSSTITFIVTFI